MQNQGNTLVPHMPTRLWTPRTIKHVHVATLCMHGYQAPYPRRKRERTHCDDAHVGGKGAHAHEGGVVQLEGAAAAELAVACRPEHGRHFLTSDAMDQTQTPEAGTLSSRCQK